MRFNTPVPAPGAGRQLWTKGTFWYDVGNLDPVNLRIRMQERTGVERGGTWADFATTVGEDNLLRGHRVSYPTGARAAHATPPASVTFRAALQQRQGQTQVWNNVNTSEEITVYRPNSDVVAIETKSCRAPNPNVPLTMEVKIGVRAQTRATTTGNNRVELFYKKPGDADWTRAASSPVFLEEDTAVQFAEDTTLNFNNAGSLELKVVMTRANSGPLEATGSVACN